LLLDSGRSGTLVQRKVPIESLSIGSRVPTKNPNRWEIDPQAEPDPATWAKLSITVQRSDGGVVDAELIRPRSWMEAYDLRAGRTIPLNLPELEVSGVATITAISACPPIATGEGSVITGRFMTRQVDEVTRVDILGADGTAETITGTSIHPVWSVDRQVWVPLAELEEGETLQGIDGPAIVLSVSLSRVTQPVYNIEVHGEHVYQVGELGVLVHNSCFDDAPNNFSLSASKNFNQQSHGGRAKQFLEELTGTKITEKLKTPEGTAAVLRGWEEQIRNGTLKAKGQYFDPARPKQVFDVFEGSGFTLLRSLDGALISVQRSTFDMIQRLLPKT
jgi:hypothetical protein